MAKSRGDAGQPTLMWFGETGPSPLDALPMSARSIEVRRFGVAIGGLRGDFEIHATESPTEGIRLVPVKPKRTAAC